MNGIASTERLDQAALLSARDQLDPSARHRERLRTYLALRRQGRWRKSCEGLSGAGSSTIVDGVAGMALATKALLQVEWLRACRVALTSACNARRPGEPLPTIACFCP